MAGTTMRSRSQSMLPPPSLRILAPLHLLSSQSIAHARGKLLSRLLACAHLTVLGFFFFSSFRCRCRTRGAVVGELQLRLLQLGLRWNVTGNTMSHIFSAVGDSLRALDILAVKPNGHDEELPPVEGDEFGPAPARSWHNRFDRLRAEVCGMHSDTVRLYAMCPDRACGKLLPLEQEQKVKKDGQPQKLEQAFLLPEAHQKCKRKLLSEPTAWPSWKEKPVWNPNALPVSDEKNAPPLPEPTCSALLTKAGSKEPLLIFTYRPLKLSLATVL
jgi:hypothetical protein